MRFSILVIVVPAVGLLFSGFAYAQEPAVAAIPTPAPGVENPAVESNGWNTDSQALLGQIFAPAKEVEGDAADIDEPADIDPTLDWTTQSCTPGIVCYSISDCYPGRCHVDLYAGTHLCVCP